MEETNREIYLESEEEKIKNAAEIAAVSESMEKFIFIVFYTLSDKEVILSELKRIGAVIVNHTDKDSAVTVKMGMEQLAAIKTLECVERVEMTQAVKQSENSSTNGQKLSTNAGNYDIINTQQNDISLISRASINDSEASVLCYGDGSGSDGDCDDCSNDMSSAIYLPLSTWKSGSIHCPYAERWYRFTASVSNALEYTIYTEGSLDTMGYLYDANGSYIAYNDDSSNMNFSITRSLTYGATYYLCVRAYGGNTGEFNLRIDYTIASTENDEMSSAIDLSLNSWQSGEICCPGAEIWYKFTPSTTAYYTIYTVGSLDTYGYLYDSDGTEIDHDDDDGSELNFKITSRLIANQTYYIKLRAYGNNTGYFSIAVTNTVFVESITIYQTDVSMNKGATVALNATVKPSNATNNTVRWETSDPSVARVGPSGVVTAIGGGTACIRACAQDGSGKSACCEVTVNVPVESVTINTTSLLMFVGETERLYADICPIDADNTLIRWSSSDTSVAWVNEATGRVEARDVGSATIYATAQDGTGRRGSCDIRVEEPVYVQGIDICYANYTMNVGDTTYLSYDIYPYDATNKSVTWCSTDTSVAEVNSTTGRIVAKKAGSTLITVTTDDGCYVDSCNVFIDFPDLFKDFVFDNTIALSNVKYTDDGFFLVTDPLSTILTRNGIGYLSENVDTNDVTNVTAYYDDWYIFAIQSDSILKYGLCKMREQENDYVKGSSDFDDPGVTISFINLDENIIMNCIESATKQNTYNLLQALNKVTGPGVYEHDEGIASYFADVKSKGAYLVAEEYVNLIAQKCIDGTISVPNNFIAILDEIDSIDAQLENIRLDNDAILALINKRNALVRVPNWLVQINENAGYNVYNANSRTISIADKNNLSLFEKYAILSTYTADVNFNSFAAEVEFHADAVNDWKSDIPWLGNKWYESAIRADMAIGEEYESGFYNEYYDLDSDLVKSQAYAHGEY